MSQQHPAREPERRLLVVGLAVAMSVQVARRRADRRLRFDP